MRLTGAVDIVERAYALAPGPDAWLRSLLEAMSPSLDVGEGLSLVVANLQAARPGVVHHASRGDPRLISSLVRFNEESPMGTSTLFTDRLVSFTSSRTFFRGRGARYVDGFLGQFGFTEFLGLYALDGEGQALFVAAPSRRRLEIHGHVKTAWERVGLHLGAAMRLRRRVLQGAHPIGHFLPSGRAVHLEDEATQGDTRTRLVEAVRASERARGRLRRSPAEALEVWRGLVDGRFSLVETLEADGRRLLVVHRNAPGLGDPRALTARERTLLSYLSHAATNAQVAYAMGLDPSSVASATRRLLKKLRLPNREALIGLSDPSRLERLPVALRGLVLEVLSVPALRIEPSRRARLSPAQTRVAEGVLAGQTDADIAGGLGRSPRTVSNLLRQAYARAGVRDRVSFARWLTGG